MSATHWAPSTAASSKRFIVKPMEGGQTEEVKLILSRVSSQETQSLVEKLQNLSGLNQVSIVSRIEDRPSADTFWQRPAAITKRIHGWRYYRTGN
jgi:hypothetical protein